MKRCIFYSLSYMLVTAIAVSCDSAGEAVTPDHDYLPTKAGFFVVYDVDSVGYNGVGNTVESFYQLKTVVVDSFLNVQDEYTYVIHRYRRPSQFHSWVYLDTWSARRDGRRTIVSEESTEYVKFIVPPTTGQTWNGNLLNAKGEDDYELVSQGTSCQVGNLVFDGCLVINQNNEDDGVVFADERREIYALDVGLVSREERIVFYCTSGCNTIGLIESGYTLSQRIIEFGVE